MNAKTLTTLLPALGLAASILAPADAGAAYGLPKYDHVVVVIEENHAYNEIIGNPNAPYFNSLASGNASLTNYHGVEHPSLPNYLDLFSGSDQGVHDDNAAHSFTTPNLGSALQAAGQSFAMYSENLPAVGSLAFNDSAAALYARKHNPASEFQGTGPNQLDPSVNQPFSAFPTDYSKLPTVSFVAPNQANDMHGNPPYTTSDANLIKNGDTWLQNNLGGYVDWAKTHNSLFVVVFDENDFVAASNQVVAILAGAHVKPGQYDSNLNHYNLLATIEDMYNAPLSGNAATAPPITQPFVGAAVPEPASMVLLAFGGLLGLGFARRERLRHRAA